MQKKPTIVYVIDNLGRGGAETLLVGILPEISLQYKIVLVTLTDVCDFEPAELKYCEKFTLGFKGKINYLSTILKLRKILHQYKPTFIHTHLIMSSQLAKLANQGRFPLLYSVHSVLSSNIFNKSWFLKKIEKLLFNQNDFLIAVSSVVLKDYETSIGIVKNAYVIDNYISDEFLNSEIDYKIYNGENQLKLAAVGNIKEIKNYEYILKALARIGNNNISMDIYGNGDKVYIKKLQTFINEHKLPVKFKGSSSSVNTILERYDFFVMSSNNEGFGIAAIEAMAVGLPLILSDIPVFRNITHGNALFFNLGNSESFIRILHQIQNNEIDLNSLSSKGKKIVQQHYTKKEYISRMLSIYRIIESRQNH